MTVDAPRLNQVTTGSRRGEGREVIIKAPFASGRRAERCGMKKNGFNKDSANVICSRPPESTLPRLIAQELAASGFRVLTDFKQVGPSTIVLTGKLDQFFVEPKSNFFNATWETDINLFLKASTGSGLVAERRFYVKGEEATVMSTADAQVSVDSAVRQLVASVVGAVANLADRLPSPTVATLSAQEESP